MLRVFAFAFSALFSDIFGLGQQISALTPAPPPATDTIYYVGSGVVSPRAIRPGSPSIAYPHCGAVIVSAVINAKGKAGEIEVAHTDNPKLDKLATKLLTKTKFEPGTYNGVAAAVAITATVYMESCATHTISDNPPMDVAVREPPGNDAGPQSDTGADVVSVPAGGIYKVGGSVSAPIVINSVPPRFSSYVPDKEISGACLIGLIVDRSGHPRNVHVIRSLEPNLDDLAIDAVKQYRFKPAMKDGKMAVPVEVNVEVNFHLSGFRSKTSSDR